jgi:hypothetical protein
VEKKEIEPRILDCLAQWSSTRGPQKIFWNTQFLNKIRADVDKSENKKQCQVSR